MSKVLVIEDEVSLQKIYEKKFTELGMQVVQSLTGAEGLEMVKKERPDVVLLDIMLPGEIDGFRVLEEIKKDENLKNTPVVVLTNLGAGEKTALTIGATDYIIKANTSLEDVVKKVQEYATKK